MPAQVFGAQAAAGLLEHMGDCGGDFPFVESFFPTSGHCSECTGEARIAENFARLRRTAVDRQFETVKRRRELLFNPERPAVGDDWRDRKAFIRQANGRCEYLLHVQLPKGLHEVALGGTGPGHGHCVGMVGWKFFTEALPAQTFQSERLRGSTRSIEGVDFSPPGFIVKGETISPDACRRWRSHIECGCGRYGRIRRISPRSQNLEACSDG